MKRAMIAAALLAATTAIRADDDKTHRFPSTAMNTMERAGNPQEVRKHAAPAYSKFYTGGYIGGGRLRLSAGHKEGRDPATEGTWGWDYVGLGRRPGRVFLDWWHGAPKEPEMGTYSAEGRKVKDPIAGHPVQKAIHGHEKHEE